MAQNDLRVGERRRKVIVPIYHLRVVTRNWFELKDLLPLLHTAQLVQGIAVLFYEFLPELRSVDSMVTPLSNTCTWYVVALGTIFL